MLKVNLYTVPNNINGNLGTNKSKANNVGVGDGSVTNSMSDLPSSEKISSSSVKLERAVISSENILRDPNLTAKPTSLKTFFADLQQQYFLALETSNLTQDQLQDCKKIFDNETNRIFNTNNTQHQLLLTFRLQRCVEGNIAALEEVNNNDSFKNEPNLSYNIASSIMEIATAAKILNDDQDLAEYEEAYKTMFDAMVKSFEDPLFDLTFLEPDIAEHVLSERGVFVDFSEKFSYLFGN